MAILAIDTCLQSCSAAVLVDEDIKAVRQEHREKGHAERLAPLVQEVVTASDVGFDNISSIVVTVGPGSFTGVRVGLAFARGLAIGRDVQVVGLTTLLALAAGMEVQEDTLRVVLVDARRGQVYGQLFQGKGLQEVTEPFVLTPEQARHNITDKLKGSHAEYIGTGVPLVYPELMNRKEWSLHQPDPVVITRLGAQLPVPEKPPGAFYLRPADAKPAKPAFST